MKYKYFTVEYMLNEEEVKRLQKITEMYKEKYGYGSPEEKQFALIMFEGSKYDIDKKFRFHEWRLGLRETFLEEEEIINSKSSVLEKLSENQQKINASDAYDEHRQKDYQNER